MKPSYILAAAAALVQALSLNAQNFNPKVEVTNTYEVKAMDVKKQDLPMNVPDSLLQFVYNVDYSVFDNPYKGSYEFKPYMIEMTPEARLSDARKLFIRAGAGYTLHPEFDLVWTPVLKHNLHVSLYDRFRGYYGPFGCCMFALDGAESHSGISHLVAPDGSGRFYAMGNKGIGTFIFGKLPAFGTGYLFDNRAGVNLCYNADELRFDLDAAYRLLASSDTLASHLFHALDLSGKIIPHRAQGAGYFQGADIRVVSGTDRSTAAGMPPYRIGDETPAADGVVDTRHFVTDLGGTASFAGALSERSAFAADVAMQAVFNNGLTDASAFNVYVTPKYQLYNDRGFLSLGVRLSFLGSSDSDYYAHRSKIVYPDVSASYAIFPDRLTVFGDITGGDRINSYNSLLERNPYMDSNLCKTPGTLDSSSERVNFKAGLKGTAGAHFKYELSGGYAVNENGLCDAIAYWFPPETYGDVFSRPYIFGKYAYCDYDIAFASASFLWKSPRVDVQGRFRYADTRFVTGGEKVELVVAEAPYSGGLSFTYNWQSRLYAGISADVMSGRPASKISVPDLAASVLVPGYVDLGLNLSFKATDRWTVWAKGGNLLNDAVQQYFLHCEKGMNFTLGFCWNM